MPGVLILIACCFALTLLIGLPLLLKPDSPVPDMIVFGILAVLVAAFIWIMGAYWIVLPILALVMLVAWLDREGGKTPEAGPGMSGRTRLRLRLWIAALCAMGALLVPGLILAANGMISIDLIAQCLVIGIAATNLFRFSFYRSCLRERAALAEAAAPATSPAGFG